MADDDRHLRRRGGRWIREDVKRTAEEGAKVASSVPRSSEPRTRAGGRWVPVGKPVPERAGLLQQVVSRSWLLLIPILGISWANNAFVRPTVDDAKSSQNRRREWLLDQKDSLRTMVSALQTESQELSAEIDSLFTPQISLYQVMCDSLVARRVAYSRKMGVSEGELDSLLEIREQLRAAVGDLERTHLRRSTILRNLESWEASLQDSIAVLTAHAEADSASGAGAEKSSRGIGSYLARLGYVAAPILGLLWAHQDS